MLMPDECILPFGIERCSNDELSDTPLYVGIVERILGLLRFLSIAKIALRIPLDVAGKLEHGTQSSRSPHYPNPPMVSVVPAANDAESETLRTGFRRKPDSIPMIADSR